MIKFKYFLLQEKKSIDFGRQNSYIIILFKKTGGNSMMNMDNMQEMMKKYMDMMTNPSKMMEMMSEFMKSYINPTMWEDFMKKYMETLNGFMSMNKK